MIKIPDTKQLLELSVMELISEHTIDKISVKDIAKNCNLSTRTFYNHFKDKYEIINSCYISILENYYIENKDNLDFRLWLLHAAEIVCNNTSFYINIFKYTGQNNARLSVVTPLRALYFRLIEEVYHDEITPALYDSITFFVTGCLAYVEEALSRKTIPDPQTTVAYYENVIPANLKKYFDMK